MSMHTPATPELSTAALTNWLRSQPATTEYTYQDPAKCLLGRYFLDHDAEEGIAEIHYEQIPEYRAIAAPKPHTLGAALARAEQLLALPAPTPAFDQPVVELGEPAPAEGSSR